VQSQKASFNAWKCRCASSRTFAGFDNRPCFQTEAKTALYQFPGKYSNYAHRDLLSRCSVGSHVPGLCPCRSSVTRTKRTSRLAFPNSLIATANGQKNSGSKTEFGRISSANQLLFPAKQTFRCGAKQRYRLLPQLLTSNARSIETSILFGFCGLGHHGIQFLPVL